nr:hypothetical protein [Tanacetum cinerariifolium]
MMESQWSHYSRFYKMKNEMIRNNLTVATMQVNVQLLQQLQPEWSRYIAKLITPSSESASEEDSDPEQAQRDKDMQKNLALIAKKPKRVKDYTYHKKKMLMCEQAKKGVPLQAEQADWLADTDEEIDEQELKSHYSFMERFRKSYLHNQIMMLSHQNRELVDQAWEKHSHDHLRAPTDHDMDILIKTCLMPLALKTQNNSFTFVHELMQEIHAELKKCVFNSDHYACVSKVLNDMNAITKKTIVVPISTRKPKSQANKSVATPPKKTVASESTIQKSKSYYRMLYEKTCPYTPTIVVTQDVPVTENSPAVPEHTTVETILNMSPDNKDYFESKKKAIHLILTGIGDEIYLTIDACKTTHEIWKAIERLQQEQSDWLADTDEDIDEQELEAHYSYMAKIQEVSTADSGTDSEPLEQVQYDAGYNMFASEIKHSKQSESISNTCVVETDDSNVIPDSPDMCDNDIQNDQNAVEYDDE